MSALGQKQTLPSEIAMSALPPKADIGRRQFDVRFVPKENVGSPQRCSGGLFTMSDEDFVDHVEHANSKLLLH
jgi:hypothetical protein